MMHVAWLMRALRGGPVVERARRHPTARACIFKAVKYRIVILLYMKPRNFHNPYLKVKEEKRPRKAVTVK